MTPDTTYRRENPLRLRGNNVGVFTCLAAPFHGRTRLMTRALSAMAAISLLAFACGSNDLCDTKQLSRICDYGTSGAECVQFSGLSTNDFNSSGSACVVRGGNPDAGSCPAGAVGSCSIPHTASNIDVTCSPTGVIVAHYYASAGAGLAGFTTATAQQNCQQIPDAGFTPN